MINLLKNNMKKKNFNRRYYQFFRGEYNRY